MAGTDISPTNVNIYDESNQLGGIFDFPAPYLNPGDATNSLLLTYPDGSLVGGDLQWRYRKTEDNSLTGFATAPIEELPAIPIPAAVWLLGSGLIGLVGFRKRMKN